MTVLPFPLHDSPHGEAIVPLPLALAVRAAYEALEQAPATCRFHGDVPPAKPGGWTSACDSCEQPARVRKALALLRNAYGLPHPPRWYTVDDTAEPHRVSGLFPVERIRGLFAPADVDQAREVIERELSARGEVGPFEIAVTLKGGDRG